MLNVLLTQTWFSICPLQEARLVALSENGDEAATEKLKEVIKQIFRDQLEFFYTLPTDMSKKKNWKFHRDILNFGFITINTRQKWSWRAVV